MARVYIARLNKTRDVSNQTHALQYKTALTTTFQYKADCFKKIREIKHQKCAEDLEMKLELKRKRLSCLTKSSSKIYKWTLRNF